ncbi:putative lysine decarboxylase family protein [Perilla frutescens var. hirtella]|nr:putative lysine decarboxylase family protein [Perilla frutescens var. hirtella]
MYVCSNNVFFFQVKKEIEKCYGLIRRLGRGVVYLGSARLGPDHPHFVRAFQLAKGIADLLDCTTWSGAGPGLMDVVTTGALEAGKSVGGFKIGKEAGQWTATDIHPYLPLDSHLTCRKHGLVDAAVRTVSSEKTAVVALPGEIGTLDEAFETSSMIVRGGVLSQKVKFRPCGKSATPTQKLWLIWQNIIESLVPMNIGASPTYNMMAKLYLLQVRLMYHKL